MKNFTKQNFKTNPLWIRLLIMVFMLIGANTAWSAYYAVGPAVGGWGTWVELKTTDNNKYTCVASPGEFKITNENEGWGLDKNWDNVVGGTGVTKSDNNGNNASLQSGYNQICFYPTGNNNNGWLEGETVTANAGFFELNAWNIYYNGDWIDGGIDANSSHDLGELTSAPNITGLLVNVWKNSNGDVCGVSAKYKVNDGTLQDLDFSDDNGWDNEASGSNTNQTIKDESISLDLPSTPGQYTVTITFTASINNNGHGNCKESAEMTAVITYSIKGYSLGGWLNNSDKQAFQQTWVLTPEGDGIYTHNYSNFDGTQYFQIYEDDNTCWGRGKGAYDPIEIGGSSVLTKGTCDEKVGITLTNKTDYVFTFEIDKNDNTKGTLSISLACTKPSKPTLSKTSDTTCPNVNYTLPTATNKGSYTQKWYNSDGTEVTSPVKVSARTKYTTKLINGTCESDATEFTLNVTSKPAAPEIEAVNNQICEGVGTATISIKEYSSEYTYALYKEDTPVANPNFNSETGEFTISVAGIYRVTATESTCNLESNKSNDITINYYTAPIIDENTYSVTNETLCNTNNNNDGIISLNPTNGVSYSLSKDGIIYDLVENKWSDLAAGTYTLTATLNACQKLSNTKEIIVGLTDNTAIKTDISITADKNPICYGTKAKLTCTEISDASYLWNTNETTSEITTENLTSNTTFSVKVSKTENGCTTTKETSITINVNSDVLKPNLTEESTSICSGSSVNLGEFAPEGTVWYENQACTEPIQTTTVFPTGNITYYAKAKDGECLSSEYTELTINVTTTPVITGVTVTTPNKPVTLTSSVENTVWSCSGGSLSSSEGKTVTFTASSTEEYIITAKNKDNADCSASVTVYVRESLYYIYIRRPKNGETDTNYDAYELWYEYSNDDQKGGASWFEEGEAGSDIGDNDAEGKNDPNYGGYAPEFSFEDCNDYIWDAFAPANLTTNYKFHIHAPNGKSSVGYATFTQTTTINSMSTDLYYKIKEWDGSSQGVVLTQVTGNNIPTPRPEVATPIISMEPIICSGTNATLEITNPQNGVTYTLTYNGETQGDPISYNGSNEVKFSVNQAGTYMVNAETTEGTCKGSATSRGENLKIITTSVSFSQSEYTTTPWIPVTVKINVPKGYSYTYTDTDITNITPAENAPIKKVNGTEITYTFPRPNAEGTVDPWGIGNTTGDGWGEKVYQVEATITGAPDACDSATATVKLQDEGNDKCTTTNN